MSPMHDRLDLKLHTELYSDCKCGSINVGSMKPEFCDFDCPTLHGQQSYPPEQDRELMWKKHLERANTLLQYPTLIPSMGVLSTPVAEPTLASRALNWLISKVQ